MSMKEQFIEETVAILKKFSDQTPESMANAIANKLWWPDDGRLGRGTTRSDTSGHSDWGSWYETGYRELRSFADHPGYKRIQDVLEQRVNEILARTRICGKDEAANLHVLLTSYEDILATLDLRVGFIDRLNEERRRAARITEDAQAIPLDPIRTGGRDRFKEELEEPQPTSESKDPLDTVVDKL
jgi:hypothetical protein